MIHWSDLVLGEPETEKPNDLGLLPDGIYANTCLKEQFHSLPGKEDLRLGSEGPGGPPEGTSLFPAQLLGSGRTEQQE